MLYARKAFVAGPDSIFISAGYWGLVVALGVLTLGGAVLGAYASEARKAGASCVLPANMMFEKEDRRYRPVSIATILVFALIMLISVQVFASRYGESKIHCWDSVTPIADGFWSSRKLASSDFCKLKGDMFSIASRFDDNGKVVAGVWQYIPFWTDFFLLGLAAAALLALGLAVVRWFWVAGSLPVQEK